jgi:hypothetical protein
MARYWLSFVGFGNRVADVTLYNSPGSGQYKYGWWGTLPLVSGTLRSVKVYIDSPSGSPSLDWAIYSSVPANGVPSGTPAASGTITGIASAGWYELTSNANMTVTRGQPFMIWFGCTAGTSLVIKSSPFSAYDTIFGLSPAGTWWLSADGSSWSAGPSYTHYATAQLEYSVETNSTTEWFGAPLASVPTSSSNLNSSSMIIGQSYQLPYPIRIEGVAFWLSQNGPPLGLLRCELRSIDTTTWEPDMSAAGLIDFHEQEYSWQTHGTFDHSKLAVLFPESRQVQNFAVLLRWARYDAGSIRMLLSHPASTSVLSRYGVNTVMRYIESSNGGSSWTVSNSRASMIRFFGYPYQFSSGSGGGQPILPPMPLVQTFM